MDETLPICIIVEGPAIPQPRPRFFTVGNYVKVVSNPTKHPVTAFKKHVAIAAKLAYQGGPLEGALRLNVTFVLPRPQSLVWKTKEMPRAWHKGIPDLDNLLKAVKDALKGIVWVDDSQVSVIEAGKVIGSGAEQARTIITISKLG